MKKFVFNHEENRFDRVTLSIGRACWNSFCYVVVSLALALACYMLFSAFFDTREERELRLQNERLEERIGRLEERIDLLDKVIGGLQARDRELYGTIFNSVPPGYVMAALDTNSLDLSKVSTLSPDDVVWHAYVGIARMESRARRVEIALEAIREALARKEVSPTAIPSIIPVADFTITQTGASTGEKFNPFFKSLRHHEGIDLVAPAGTPVLAAADGVVAEVIRGGKVHGNRIVLSHGGGTMRTSYSHLSCVKAARGQRVRQGAVIGEVGNTGRAFAPHLHYEVLRNGVTMEPVHYFFADLDRTAYHDMLMMALTNGQSLD